MPKPGFIKSWRREMESDIWIMPPLYHRVWHYLLQSVSWEKNTFPTKNMFSIHLNPGQGLFSISQIVDGVSWVERSVKKQPNKKTILDILRWLEFQGMIARESNGSGTYISISNWCKYQSEEKPKVTESIPEGIPQGIPEGIHTKEVKEKKEGKEEKIKGKTGARFTPPSLEEVTAYCEERKNNIDPQYWIDSYAAKGWIVGKAKMIDWKAAIRTWEKNGYSTGNGKTKQTPKTFSQIRDENMKKAMREFAGEDTI